MEQTFHIVKRIKILDKTFRVLSGFSPEQPEWGVSELAREFGLPKATVHRILQVLVAYGYVSRSPSSRRFRVAPAALDLRLRAQAADRIRTIAAPVLSRVARASGDSAVLLVLNQARDRAILVERAVLRTGLQIVFEVGQQFPLHAPGGARVMLAYFSETEIEEVAAKGLERLGPGTITDPRDLRSDLKRIVKRGYAISREESQREAGSVSAPIFDPDERVIGSVAIVVPLTRFRRARIPRLSELVRTAAADLSSSLRARSIPRSRASDEGRNGDRRVR